MTTATRSRSKNKVVQGKKADSASIKYRNFNKASVVQVEQRAASPIYLELPDLFDNVTVIARAR